MVVYEYERERERERESTVVSDCSWKRFLDVAMLPMLAWQNPRHRHRHS